MRPITAAPSALSSSVGFEHLAELRAVDADAQEHRDEREEGGESPHDALQPAHRDAEQRRAVGVLGRAAQRDADRREPEEQRRARARMIGTTISVSTSLPKNFVLLRPLPDREVQVDERRVLHDVAAAEPVRQQQSERDEDLGDADRRDREDQPRRAEEPAQEQELDEHAEHDRRRRRPVAVAR